MSDKALAEIAAAIRDIAYGTGGPGGLEALVMALKGNGDPGNSPLSETFRDGYMDIAGAIREGLESIAHAIADADGWKKDHPCIYGVQFSRLIDEQRTRDEERN